MPNYTRPEAMQESGSFGFQSTMDDLQKRAMMATAGVAGTEGRFRDQGAQDYYKNLFMRNFINDQGQPGEFGDILPIELQYMQQVLGIDPGNSTSSLMSAFGLGHPDASGGIPGAAPGIGAGAGAGGGAFETRSPGGIRTSREGGDGSGAFERSQPGYDPNQGAGNWAGDLSGFLRGPLSIAAGFLGNPLTGIGNLAYTANKMSNYPTEYGLPQTTRGLENDPDFMTTVNRDITQNPDIFGGVNVPAAGTTSGTSTQTREGGDRYDRGVEAAESYSGEAMRSYERDYGGGGDRDGGFGKGDDPGGGAAGSPFHEGGVIPESRVPGKTGADTQETLQEGEYVIRKEVVDKLGPAFFDAINKAFAPK